MHRRNQRGWWKMWAGGLMLVNASVGGFAGLSSVSVPGRVSRGATAEFHALGFIGDPSLSIAYGVSADGVTAVGETIAPEGFEAFRWTSDDGMVGLGWFPDPPFPSSKAFAASADGKVIVGSSTRPDSLLEDGAPFRWTLESGLVLIPNLGGTDTGGIAEALTPDGSVIVGLCASPNGYRAFRWTEGTGTLGLGEMANEQLSAARGVSADGSIIVGNVSQGSTTFPRPFRWTAPTGKVILPELNSGTVGSANAITPDGNIMAGLSAGRAVRWQDGQVHNLGEVPGGNPTSLYWADALTVDGRLIVGLADYNATQGSGEAFIWDATNGIRGLRGVLASQYGLVLPPGWSLFEARGISAHGVVIVGYGFDPQGFQEAWLVRFIMPLGDLNCDGVVDFDDINPFVLVLSDAAGYAAAYPDCDPLNADCNGDGSVNFDDINAFVALLSQ